MRLETNLEDQCCEIAENFSVLNIPLKRTAAQRGWPDRMFLAPGEQALFVEFKREKTGRVSAQQKENHRKLRELGFVVGVVDDVQDFLKLLRIYLPKGTLEKAGYEIV